MTLHLALDRDGLSAPDGKIAGIAKTLPALRAAGFAADPYTGDRVSTIDETDQTKWDADCGPGWYLIGGAVKPSPSPSDKDQFNEDLRRFKAIYEQADLDLQEILVWERTDRNELNGHSWVEDLLHGWMIPWTRRCVAAAEAYRTLLAAANPDATALGAAKAAWREALHGPAAGARAGFGYIRELETLGLKTWYGAADRGTDAWRATALLQGTLSYATAGAAGDNGKFGYAAGSVFAVTYPASQTVATWPMRAGVLAIEEIT